MGLHGKKTSAGCRPDALLGLWSIEPTRFRSFESQAREAMRAGLIKPPSADYGEPLPEPTKAAVPPYRVLRGVAVIDICGPMTKYETSFQSILGGTSTVRAREAVRAAVRDPGVRGIMLRIDSPGGSVAGTSDLAEAVKQANAKKPVYAYAEDCCCSAAYWVASQGRRLLSNSTAIVGSIGTFAVVWDSSGMYAEAGIKVHVVASAPLKGAGTDGQAITDEMLADWQREISEINDVFVAGVSKGRSMPIATARDLADGRVHVGANAEALGLIDGVASFDAALKELEKLTMAQEKDSLDLAIEQEQRAIKAEAALAESMAQNTDLKARLEKIEGEKAKADPLAAASPEIQAEVEKIRQEAAKANERIAKLEDERLTKEFEGKVAALKALALPITLAGSLRRVAAALPEDAKAIESALKAADEQCAKGALFAEAGRSGGEAAADSAFAKANALAKELVAKGEAKTVEQAITLVFKRDRKLYDQHLSEQRKGN